MVVVVVVILCYSVYYYPIFHDTVLGFSVHVRFLRLYITKVMMQSAKTSFLLKISWVTKTNYLWSHSASSEMILCIYCDATKTAH